jgi:hypothetical protein
MLKALNSAFTVVAFAGLTLLAFYAGWIIYHILFFVSF